MEPLEIIIERVRQGDRAAYEIVVRRFQDMAVGYAYSLLGDVHLAEDAAQEAFITAYYDLAALRDVHAFPGWFRRIVFKHVDRLGRGKRIPIISLDYMNDVAAYQHDPTELAERRELKDQVRAAITALPQHQRVVVTLFYISAYSLNEISLFLDVPVATVKTRLHAARQALKARMLAMINEQLPEQRPSKDDQFIGRVMPFIFQPMDEASVRTFLRWRYNAPYDMYNVTSDQTDEAEVSEAIRFFLDPHNKYYRVADEQGELVAFCCFGWDAQVPGGEYSADALDIGMQMRPDLIRQTEGLMYVQTFLEFARRMFAPRMFRTTIAAFNTTEISWYEQAGFQQVQTFRHRDDGRIFVILTRDA